MKLYLVPLSALDASSSPQEIFFGGGVQIGDLVLSIISINGGSTGANVLDQTAQFASSLTDSVSSPGTPVLIQNGGNLNGERLIALMQRGSLQS